MVAVVVVGDCWRLLVGRSGLLLLTVVVLLVAGCWCLSAGVGLLLSSAIVAAPSLPMPTATNLTVLQRHRSQKVEDDGEVLMEAEEQ